jgi:pimeloyl-ACP methyl ester carboxylesterase
VNLAQAQRTVPGLYKLWQTEHDPVYLPTLLKQISAMFWTPLNYTAEEFGQISAPTLIVQGDRDEAIPLEQAVAMYRWIPQSELAIIANMSHGAAFGDRSTAMLSVMLDFLLRYTPPEN